MKNMSVCGSGSPLTQMVWRWFVNKPRRLVSTGQLSDKNAVFYWTAYRKRKQTPGPLGDRDAVPTPSR